MVHRGWWRETGTPRSPASGLNAHDQTFLDQALDHGDLCLVFQRADDRADRKSGRVQGKLQRLAKEPGKGDAAGADLDADKVVAGLYPVDKAAPRSDQGLERQRRRLEEIGDLARD